MNIKRILVTVLPFLLFILAVILINPIGEFPLIDDWSYARTVKSSLEQGRIIICEYASMTLIVHAQTGIFVSKLFGFSFTALRFSTLAICLAGVGIFYLNLIREHKDFWLACICCILFLFNPLFFFLSFTFMTDNTFCIMFLISGILYYRFLKDNRTVNYAAATLFCLLALLIRQIAIVVPIAFFFSYLIQHKFSLQKIITALLPLIACITIFKLYNLWFSVTQSELSLYGEKEGVFLNKIISQPLVFIEYLAYFILIYFYYIGLFLFPFGVIYAFCFLKDKVKFRVFIVLSILLSLIVFFINTYVSLYFPFQNTVNVFNAFGLGIFDIFDSDYIIKVPEDLLLWKILGIVASIGLAGFLMAAYDYISSNLGNLKDMSLMSFIALTLLFYIGLISTVYIFDRYIIPIIPLGLFIYFKCMSQFRGNRKTVLSLITILCMPYILFSVTGTHVCFSWNRARWSGLDWLTKTKRISADVIDGGVEFNGWYCYSPLYKEIPDKKWYWVTDNQYVIAFQNHPGYIIEKKLPYYNALKNEEQSLYVLKKTKTYKE